jgi:AraC family transcriptional regulator
VDTIEQVVYQSDVAAIGTFRCPRHHQRFAGGATDTGLVVFPRTTVVIERERSSSVLADPNTIVFYDPGEEYRRHEVDRRGDHCDYFSLTSELVEEIAATTSAGAVRGSLIHYTHGPASAQLYLAQRRLVDVVASAAEADPLWVDEIALQIVAIAMRDAGNQQQPFGSEVTWRRHADLVERAKRVMAERAFGSVQLSEIAREVAVSPYHLARLVRRHTGFTVHQYVTQLRVRRALERLDSAVDLATLALELGFSSHSHFSSVFRGAFGRPPSAARKPTSPSEEDLRKILTV